MTQRDDDEDRCGDTYTNCNANRDDVVITVTALDFPAWPRYMQASAVVSSLS